MSRFFIPFALLGILLVGCQPKPPLDDLFIDYQGNVPGAAVVVVQGGEVVFQGMYGLADVEASTPISDVTNFRLASVTKQFTATAVMLLIDAEIIGLDTPIREIFPELPTFMNGIVIEQLLRHTSGLMDYESLMADSDTVQVYDRDVLELLEYSDSLNFEPGSAYSYSNSGYAVLAMLVERISGKSFPLLLSNHLFTPLGMNGTLAFVEGGPSVPNRAFGYSVVDSTVTFADQSTTSAVLGDGGIYSSISDLIKWDKALGERKLISTELLDKAYTPGLESYGFGWRIENVDGHLRHSHTGSTSGFRNVIQRYPDDGLTVIILTNRAVPDVTTLANQLAAMFLTDN